MHSVNVTESISFDHTFKSAANIGYLREDGVWVPQYDSLFMVLGANGQILTWQLTNGTSFAKVEPLLKDLCNRANGPLLPKMDCIFALSLQQSSTNTVLTW